MKTISWITTLLTAFCITSVSAQDHQKWYADDIYYDVSEKEISYFEITFTSYTEIESGEAPRESFEDRMSYSTRINRFHRNYYGSSLSFNYGYFHEPFHNDVWRYPNYGYDPFYDYGWSSLHYYDWNAPYYNYGWHRAWHSPWHHRHAYHVWYNPYEYGYTSYGQGKNEYTTKKVHYGPRDGLSSNVPSNSNRSYTTRSSNSSRLSNQNSLRNSGTRMMQEDQNPRSINTSFERSNSNKKPISKSNSSSAIIRPNRSNYSSQRKSRDTKNVSEWLKKEIRLKSNSQESNSGNVPSYRPSRSSNTRNSGNSRKSR